MQFKMKNSERQTFQIHDVVRTASVNEMSLGKHDIEVALRLLCESGGIVRKVGDSSGGLFVVGKSVIAIFIS